MSKSKRAVSLALSLVLLLSLFTACVSPKPAASPQTPDNTGSGEPVMGGNLTVGIAQDIDLAIEPHNAGSAGTRELLFNIYEGLVKPDTSGNLVPAIAEAYKRSEAGTEIEFTLRGGVKFHNGQTVTPADVVYSITRAAGLDTGKPLARGLEFVTAITAKDDKTVVVSLSQPDIETLASLTAAIIPEGNDPAVEAVGTGPFKFVSRVPQEKVLIEKFDEYWGTPAFVDSVTYKIYENGETMVMSLMSGAIDLAAHLTNAQVAELGAGYNLVNGEMNLVQAVYLNNNEPPFDNVDVRRALSHAIDRQNIIDFLYGGNGFPLGSSVYPSFKKYFRADLVDYYDYDVEKAKQLLSDAGYPNGFTFSLVVASNNTPHVDTATIVAEQLKQIGVTVNVELVDWATWYDTAYKGRSFEATIIGFDASTLTARALLQRFVSDNGSNFIAFNNAEYDEVYSAAQTCTDDAEQVELYGRLQEILTEQAANLYIQDLCDIIAMQANVGGYEIYPIYAMDMAKVYFTE